MTLETSAVVMEGIISQDAGMPGTAKPHVVIVGGGFAGLNAARVLARRAARVTLVDRRNHHLFQPLLYQVATAGLSPPTSPRRSAPSFARRSTRA
jgi:NADH dehydrogenase FAD-containing subunit